MWTHDFKKRGAQNMKSENFDAVKIPEKNSSSKLNNKKPTQMSQTQDALAKEEEAEFVPEEIQEMAFAIIDKIIGENVYSELKVSLWTNAIIERLLTDLAKLKRPFKYIINCSLQQRTGAGLHMASASYWDPTVDGACTVKWNNDYVHCCLHIFGLQI